jgi:hypothetical protein
MFGGGVWGTRLGGDVPQRRHEKNTSLKRSIRRGLGDALGDAAKDALSLGINAGTRRTEDPVVRNFKLGSLKKIFLVLLPSSRAMGRR